MSVNKVTWGKVGLVSEPGRYMFRHGFVTVTSKDLDVWKQFPRAEFALLNHGSDSGCNEFELGAFDVGVAEPLGQN
jgi:hypothetical protein